MRKLILIFISLATSGCSLDASIQNLAGVKLPFEIHSMAKTTGLISGSTQVGTATGGATTYYVQSTIGSYMSGIAQQDSSGKYIVYSSVQGAIVSSSK